MTFDQATRALEAHGQKWRPSAKPEHIACLAQWTQRDLTGAVISGETWEDVPLNNAEIRAWLGY